MRPIDPVRCAVNLAKLHNSNLQPTAVSQRHARANDGAWQQDSPHWFASWLEAEVIGSPCGDSLVPNEVAGVCPPCWWRWPSLPNDPASCVLARERSGLPVFGLGFRLRQPTESVVHRMKYGGFPKHGKMLGMWMGRRWRAPPENITLMPVPSIGDGHGEGDSTRRRRFALGLPSHGTETCHRRRCVGFVTVRR